jgi:hypothetical protein
MTKTTTYPILDEQWYGIPADPQPDSITTQIEAIEADLAVAKYCKRTAGHADVLVLLRMANDKLCCLIEKLEV